MAHTNCKIESIIALTEAVFEVTLIPDQSISHKAGQYLKVVLSDEDARPFSIANPEVQEDKLVLQIGATPDNPYAWEVLEKMRASDTITIDAPHGNAYLRDDTRPIILLAGGTGFSYAYALLQQALIEKPNTHVDLFWGVRKQSDMYCMEHLESLEQQHPNFNFHPVIEHPDTDWDGLTGWVHKAVMCKIESLADYDVYVAGRFEMAKTIKEDFGGLGLPAEQLIGDAFDYL
jgi:aquacobalamin reductase/NAD(P)H-flavin reductase